MSHPTITPEATVASFEPFFLLTPEHLKEIVAEFRQEFAEGLSRYGCDVAMVPSFVTGVPDGTETGTFLALDLGGTNLRVCEIILLGNHKFEIKQQKYKVSEELKRGEARVLFDYIADSVDAFMQEVGSDMPANEAIHLGFTFSFPVEQTALDQGKLLTWTKGFSAKNAIGHDVVKLLQDALDRKHIHVRCSALVNDTVGTLLSRSYQSGPALIGAIFGTGTNGAYIDHVTTIKKLGEEAINEAMAGGKTGGEYMVVNTEWGALDNGRKVLPVSMFDNKLDRKSINPRKQAFEKMVSGMYLGEIVRNILLHLIDLSILFDGHSSPALNSHYGFDTALVSAIENSTSTEDVVKVLVGIDIPRELINDGDAKLVQWACRIVATRAASLAACAIAAVVLHTGSKDGSGGPNEVIDVGLDGTVAEFLPNFEVRMRKALREILGEEGEKRIKMGLAKDGSGIGAALCALQAKKAEKKGIHPNVESIVPTVDDLKAMKK